MTTSEIRSLVFSALGAVVIFAAIILTLATHGNFIPLILAGMLFIITGTVLRLRGARVRAGGK